MITITLIFLAVTIGYLYICSINPGSNCESAHAKSQLSEIIDKLFDSFPLQKLMNGEKECNLSVRFTVNEYYEITNLKISGGNEELVKFAHSKLPEEIEKYVEDIIPNKYSLKLRFVME